MKKILHANRNERKLGEQYSYQEKDSETKNRKREKEGYYIMTKGSIHEEYITIVNI